MLQRQLGQLMINRIVESERADFDPRIDQTVLATNVIKDATRGTMGINTSILGQDTGKAKSGVVWGGHHEWIA